jgi:sugar fermentation stimulation protein A
MRFDPPLIPCTFLRRYQRFFADVRLPASAGASEDVALTVHCPNSGSMRGVGLPDRPAWITDSGNPARKLRHTLEVIEVADGVRALVNTHRPNRLAAEALRAGAVAELAGYASVRAEVKYGSRGSRIDLLLEDGPGPAAWVEVKNVTLGEADGAARFPDAVTSRGAKHLEELIDVVAQGGRGVLLFCVSREDARTVAPADEIDPVYGRTLRAAAARGVELLARRVEFGAPGTPTALHLGAALPVLLP